MVLPGRKTSDASVLKQTLNPTESVFITDFLIRFFCFCFF